MSLESLLSESVEPCAKTVSRISSGIQENGEVFPVVIGRDGNVLSGTRRAFAAKSIGMESVPVIKFNDLSKSSQRVGIKDVVCEDCGYEWYVRKDTSPSCCGRCASKRGGRAASKVLKERVKMIGCKACGKDIPERLGYDHCSVSCRKKSTWIDRSCMGCESVFQVRKSALSGKTNASGNFCTRACYNKWMSKPEMTTGRGSRWNAIRTETVKRHPFCAVCASDRNLEVHHIVPFRLTQDNTSKNLIPLCRSCHRKVEGDTMELESVLNDVEDVFKIMSKILRAASSRSAIIYKHWADETKRDRS